MRCIDGWADTEAARLHVAASKPQLQLASVRALAAISLMRESTAWPAAATSNHEPTPVYRRTVPREATSAALVAVITASLMQLTVPPDDVVPTSKSSLATGVQPRPCQSIWSRRATDGPAGRIGLAPLTTSSAIVAGRRQRELQLLAPSRDAVASASQTSTHDHVSTRSLINFLYEA